MEKQNVNLHLLELCYAYIRVKNEARVRRLADSISRHGQLEAMLTVSSEDILRLRLWSMLCLTAYIIAAV